ncbi:hypothetical protein FRACYDRAFT_245077 [Fragilariopsis cylindrus CCMP1102]|uniref:N-acetyltransferase domain-containing protein n=1 Tax=Fragilariopsis cylindrus CCMP1102 TaxID=635003 RepID=A0A1E7F298_9STRA|nr:hypothetical protein FRACYDRAFT_245077 [Fragilariopsis cylindrus CCMP1102]|eukprot:OEU11953.1 hypothetical protein FRACYDRAFT_245077 [Fragilariopsis cylindrus CCMP1102]
MCSVAVTTETNNEDDEDDVRIRKYQPSSRDLPSVQKLFADGMRFQNAGEWYIQQSLASDLSSIEKIYFVGRGTFLVMERIILTTGSWVTSVHQFYSSLGFTNMGNVEYQNSGIILTNFQMIF